MSENFNSHIACEGTDNDINWVCKVCKDLPNYAGMYLYQREREKNQLKNVKDRRADLILLKYYYALLHLLDKIHELHECPNPENDVPKYADRKCSTPECFVYYRYIYNTYASILMTEKGLNQINLRCDICSVLPYTIFSDLEMIAKNMHSDDMEKTQKLEIEAVIADYYLEAVGSCEQWDECPSGVDWLELIKSVQLLRKYLEKKDRKELQISLNEWNRVRSIDNILNTEIKTTCRDFQTKNIPLCVLEKKTLVYMDFGVYQLYESTCDYALSSQAMEIYRYLGCKTNVIYCESSIVLNDFQFSIVNGHYYKGIRFENKDETVSQSIIDYIVNHVNKYSNILYNTNYVYSVPNETFKGNPLNSDIDVAMYDKIGKKLLIIECKWKENVYQNRENYIKIEDALKKIYDNQLEKHQTYLERDINRLNELFDNQIDFTREGDVDTLYLFVDKRIQYHDNGTNRHVIPIFMLAYLFENNSSKRQLILSDVFSEIREMKSRVRYERIKLKEPVHLGEITVI